MSNSNDILKFQKNYNSSEHNKELIDKWMGVYQVYTSNAIEGNTLTHAETAIVCTKKEGIGDKPLKHSMEALDNFEAWNYAVEYIDKGGLIGEDFIKTIHKKVTNRTLTNDEHKGNYSCLRRVIIGAAVQPLKPELIPVAMKGFVENIKYLKKSEEIFKSHAEFERIHSFTDGNGRTGRILMNCQLRQNNLPPIAVKNRKEYINSLDNYHSVRDIKNYLIYMRQQQENTAKQINFFLSRKNKALSKNKEMEKTDKKQKFQEILQTIEKKTTPNQRISKGRGYSL